MAICQYMLFSPSTLIPELKDWKPSLPAVYNRTSRWDEIPLQQLVIIDGLRNFTESMGINEGVTDMVTERSGERVDLVAGLRAVYPDLLAMEINILSDLIHKLEIQSNGRDSRGDGVIRRDDIKRALHQCLSKHNNRTEGVLFWLDWSREDADLDIFTSRPPILPDLSSLDDYMVGAALDDGDKEGEDEEDDDAAASSSTKTLKNAQTIVSVSKKMLLCVKERTVEALKYTAAKPTIEGIYFAVLLI
jgi:hypothetical protein